MFIHGKPCKNTAAKNVFGCHVVHGVTVYDMAVTGSHGNLLLLSILVDNLEKDNFQTTTVLSCALGKMPRSP